MIIRRNRSLANDHTEELASCKWSSGETSLLQMIIRKNQPLANDHLEAPASCNWHLVTLVTSAKIQIQSCGPFKNSLFLFPSFQFWVITSPLLSSTSYHCNFSMVFKASITIMNGMVGHLLFLLGIFIGLASIVCPWKIERQWAGQLESTAVRCDRSLLMTLCCKGHL